MYHSSKATVGAKGEDLTARYLQENGYTIVERNFCVRGGEIDIIATKGTIVAFVEVKTRTNHYFNTSEVVTPSKQKKIILAAKTFLMKGHFVDKVYRFDVALVQATSSKITYLEHAFCQTNC